jgi:CRP-like cAMP-binding protein
MVAAPGQQLAIQRELFVRGFFTVRPPDRVTNQLVASMRDVNFAASATIFEAGDPPDQVFFIVDGTVRLDAGGEKPWVFERESLIGILDAGMRRPRKRRAVAVTQVRAIVIDYDDYIEIMEDNFEFAKNVLSNAIASVHALSLTLPPEHVFSRAQTQGHGEEVVRAGRRLNHVERLMVLHRSPFFGIAPIQPLVVLARLAREEIWRDGDEIFRPDTPAPEIRIISRGSIRVTRERPSIDAVFGPGAMVAGVAPLSSEVHAYRAVSAGEAATLAISKEDLFDVMEDHFALSRVLFTFIASENERVRGLLVASGRSAEAPARPAAR